MSTKEQCEKIIELMKPQPCIIVTQRYEINSAGKTDSLRTTVLAQSSDYNGCSSGANTRYDYGFMKMDILSGNAVVVI